MAAKKTTKPAGGALTKTPSKPKVDPTAAKTQARETYLSTVRNLGSLTVGSPEYNAAISTVKKTGKQLGYNDNRITTAINKYQQRGTPGATPGTPESAFRGLPFEGQVQEVGSDALAYQNEAWRQEQQRLAQGMPDFSSQLESARQNVMGQFERTMGPEFERQQMELRQRMAEQGIDPNSGAYQAQMKMLNDSQNAARQNAMSQAFTQGAEYQQQGFTQGVAGRMLPFQIAQLGSEPWKLGFAARTEAQQAELNRQAQERMAKAGGGASIRAAQIQADAMRDAAAAQAMGQYGQQPRPNPWSSAAQGIGTGVGLGVTNAALR